MLGTRKIAADFRKTLLVPGRKEEALRSWDIGAIQVRKVPADSLLLDA
jgi:hypothetical protein